MQARLILHACAAVVLAACGGGSSSGGNQQADRTFCSEPRPQACTLEYLPVCGIRSSGSLATYDNGCTACADAGVKAYVPGACGLPDMDACTEPRPQICTADYRPVCGRRDDGMLALYANACSACSDASVVGFAEGPCPAP